MSSDLLLRDAYEGGYDFGDIVRVEIREGWGSHQIAIIDYPVPDSDYANLAPGGTPMALRWGTSPVDVRTFWGYVNHHEYWDRGEDQVMYLRVYCVGTSLPMNEPSPGAWRNVTPSYIARQVAERHGLRAVVHNPKTTLDYFTPGQDNDFEMMNRLASEQGAQFWVDGSTLFFVDPQVLLTIPGREVPEYRMDRTTEDTLIAVQAIDGPLAPVADAPAVQRIFGIDAGSDRFFQASSAQQISDKGLPAPISTRILTRSVDTLAEAQRLNEAASTAGSWTSVQVIAAGDAKVRVGGLVTLSGDSLNQKYQGTWMAGDIIHVIGTDPRSAMTQYTTQIELTRNQKDQVYFSTSSVMKNALTEVPAVLRGGTWQSTILESVYV